MSLFLSKIMRLVIHQILQKNFLEKNNILVLDWAAQSPDLNIIYNLWALI